MRRYNRWRRSDRLYPRDQGGCQVSEKGSSLPRGVCDVREDKGQEATSTVSGEVAAMWWERWQWPEKEQKLVVVSKSPTGECILLLIHFAWIPSEVYLIKWLSQYTYWKKKLTTADPYSPITKAQSPSLRPESISSFLWAGTGAVTTSLLPTAVSSLHLTAAITLPCKLALSVTHGEWETFHLEANQTYDSWNPLGKWRRWLI